MKKVKKILFLGSANISPINIVCKNLLDYGNFSYQFDGLNMAYDEAIEKINPYLYLSNSYKIKNNYDWPRKFRQFFKLERMFLLKCVRLFLKNCLQLKFKEARNKLDSELNFYCKLEECLFLINQYDVINVQFLHEWSARIVPFIPRHIKVVVSFWGSDLMDAAGPEIYRIQYAALQRADVITTFSTESAEIMKSKFGRELAKKNRQVFYGFTHEQFLNMYHGADKYQELANKMIKSYGYDLKNYRYVIKVGYSAFRTQHHRLILDEIKTLPEDILSKIFLIIPMTYGEVMDYPDEIESVLNEYKLNGLVIKNYLNNEEAKSLSYACNIMLNLRQNDGFNNSMLESLMAGSVVVNGSWLPYSLLRDHDIYTFQVSKIENLGNQLMYLFDEFEKYSVKANKNKDKLYSFAEGPACAKAWEVALN